MLKYNSLVNGLILGIFIPLTGYVVLTGLFQGIEALRGVEHQNLFSEGFRRRTFGIVAIGLNAIPMNMAFKRKQTDTMRGIVFPTFSYVALWLYIFGDYILA